MRQVTTTLYNFDELNIEAKQNAIEWYRDRETYDFLEEYMNDELSFALEAHKIKPIDVSVRYSLSYSQGDGASFTGEIEWGAYRATITTNSWGNHYAHSKSVDVKEMTSIKTGKDAPDKKWSELQSIVEQIGDELARVGYEYMEDLNSDETIADTITANDYEFTKEGTIA